ncbi:uncharacterized protein [Venturia canescens]|uniref:uncharacterized protein n=1 Tax=Venturia canescens TaxID=32260 RepID=UPI001C9CCF95|nr:uncharacterized protein LOC122410020 [Venturia canescens]
MSRQVCKSKQVPRIFQHRNQPFRNVVKNVVWTSSEVSCVEGGIVNPQIPTYCNFSQNTTDSSNNHLNIQKKKDDRKLQNNVDDTTKISDTTVLSEDAKGERPLLEKNTSSTVDDIEKWLKTRTESVSSIELDAMKSVVEAETEEDRSTGVDGYLADDLPHAFLGKAPDGLSIDIDLSDKKLNLDYDPLLRELQSHKLLEVCEKNDDFIMPEFRLDHLDPLVLSPHDMMVAGEILPSASHQSGSPVSTHLENNLKTSDARTNNENSEYSETEELVDKPIQVDYNLSEDLEELGEAENNDNSMSHQEIVSPNGQILQPKAVQIFDETQSFDNIEKGKAKSESRVMKQKRKIRPKPVENQITFLGEPCHIDGKDSVMAVVAISTDKISNMTQIVINTGMDEQIYQGKTSELIEATGNFPRISKLDMENSELTIRDRPHERMVSKALEELGITDESLEPALIHESGRTWLCPWDECNREFCKLHALKTHLLAHFGVRPFKCDYEGCTWAFHSEFKLKRHKETHLKRKNFVCDVPGCNRRFTTIYNLWSHEKLHTRPNRIVCQVPDCQEKFQTKRALELHMKNHDQSHAPYMCNHEGCGKRYYTSNALTSHQRCHNYKEIDVRCSWPGCGKLFDKPCRLKAHVRSHTGSKPYTCTYQDCPWAFPSSSKLKRHQKKHTNERKFVCNIEGCGKAFMRSEHLKEHLLTHAGGGYFQCYMCDAHFSAKSSLYVHIKKHQIKEAVNTITENVPKDSKQRVNDAEEPGENCSMQTVVVNDVTDPAIDGKELENTNYLQTESIDVSERSVKKEHKDFSYSCGMEGCGKSFKTLSNLANHMIANHESSIIEDYESPIGVVAPSETSDLDYILYATPGANSKGLCRTMLLESCDAIIMNESPKNVECLPEPEPPPLHSASSSLPPSPPAASSVEENSRLSESSYRVTGEKQKLDQQIRVRKTCQGSARTGLTCEDVWKLKGKTNVTETTNVGATDVVLGEANLNEALLLTEELPSMFYQDDIVGTECQILLLDGGNSENAIDLRGLE